MEQRPRSDSPNNTTTAAAAATATAATANTSTEPQNTSSSPVNRRKKKSGNRKKPARRLVSYNDDTIVSDGDDINADSAGSSTSDEGSDDDDDAMGNSNDDGAARRDGTASTDNGESGTATGGTLSVQSSSNEAGGMQRDRAAEYGFSLPAEPRGRCPAELQDKIANMHAKMRDGMDMNRLIQDRKEFRNPSIYEKLIQFCDINELGTNYPPEIYDPLQWGNESFYEELAGAQKVEMERRERERKDGLKHQLVVEAARKAEEEAKRRKSKWDQPAPGGVLVLGGPASATVGSAQVVSVGGVGTAASAVAAATALQVAKAAGAAAVAAAAAAAAAGLVQPNATGTKGTVISAFGSLPKKPKP